MPRPVSPIGRLSMRRSSLPGTRAAGHQGVARRRSRREPPRSQPRVGRPRAVDRETPGSGRWLSAAPDARDLLALECGRELAHRSKRPAGGSCAPRLLQDCAVASSSAGAAAARSGRRPAARTTARPAGRGGEGKLRGLPALHTPRHRRRGATTAVRAAIRTSPILISLSISKGRLASLERFHHSGRDPDRVDQHRVRVAPRPSTPLAPSTHQILDLRYNSVLNCSRRAAVIGDLLRVLLPQRPRLRQHRSPKTPSPPRSTVPPPLIVVTNHPRPSSTPTTDQAPESCRSPNPKSMIAATPRSAH